MIGDLVGARLERLRAQAESLLTDSCVIERPGPAGVDPDTGAQVSSWVPVWSGPCRVRTSTGAESTRAGEEPVQDGRPVAQLPVSCPQMLIGWRITVASEDRQLDGSVLFVASAGAHSQRVLRRVTCDWSQEADRGDV